MPILKNIAKILAKGVKLFAIAAAIVFFTVIIPVILTNAVHPSLGSLGPVGMVIAMRWLTSHCSPKEESTLNEYAAHKDPMSLTIATNNGFIQ